MRRQCSKVKSRSLLCLASLLVCALSAVSVRAETSTPKIVCRAALSESRRAELSEQLRAITGWPGLGFDKDGFLRFGEATPSGGSQSARALLDAAQGGKNLIILEDASGSADVAFSRVLEGRWKDNSAGRPAAFVVQIDFRDFSHVMGDRAALAAFNAGWGLMHEIEHAVRDSADAEGPGAAGECEEAINVMRRECGLAERAEYFYTPMPGSGGGDFKTRYVRLAFKHKRADNKQQRYWLVWDADSDGRHDGRQSSRVEVRRVKPAPNKPEARGRKSPRASLFSYQNLSPRRFEN